MKYCILGAGRTAQGMVAYLSQRGQQAGIWDRSQEKRSLLRECGIKMEGQCEGSYQPIVVDSLEEAAAQAEVLLIMTTAEGHMPLASGVSTPAQRPDDPNSKWEYGCMGVLVHIAGGDKGERCSSRRNRGDAPVV